MGDKMGLLDRRINKNSPIPIYYQLKQIILEFIKNGDLKPGDTLPTESELNEIFEISRTTSRQALTELVRDGYLYRVKGKGTFVASPKITQDFLNKLETYNEQMERLNKVPSTKVLALTLTPAFGEIADVFGISSGDDVIMLSRLRFADGVPNVIVDTYMPLKFKAILTRNMERTSLYQFFKQEFGIDIAYVHRELEAVVAGRQESEMLHVNIGYPIQKVRTIAYEKSESVVEYSIARYRGDNRFKVILYNMFI